MMKFKHDVQGMTLIELLIALAILTLLAVSIFSAFDGSRSRAQAMISNMAAVGGGLNRAKVDTGCHFNRVDALVDSTQGIRPDNNFCSKDFTKTWNGPYVSKFTSDSSGNATLDKISSEFYIEIQRENGGIGKRYFLRGNNVPNDVIKQALQECNGSDDTAATFDRHKCRAALGTSADVGTFDLLYDETK